MFNNVTIVGVGLISGSFAIALKEKGMAKHIIGVSRTRESEQKALQLGLIDEALPLKEAIQKSDLIYVAIPVDVTIPVVVDILDQINDQQIVADAGSTKMALCKAVQEHPMRRRLVATHPMWGTEYSGPEAAVHDAFAGRSCVICEKELSDGLAVQKMEGVYKALGMHLVYMTPNAHDVHAAYVSHISHITSFALANTVLEKEKEEDAIFDLAGGGFESTVRLAKSNPAMWGPIFMQNRENVLDVLNEHIVQLRKFKACLEKENYTYLIELMENANKIKRILQ
ncbi:MAG: prephenate dehydrogenase [Hydrotalea flava]|uniref:prephenate dehydrogenase n=3 Tax=Chitinophagaceae TaxID=563835 RepID=UPI000941F64B|nr:MULTISPECIES: prephenate dehydrogenase [Hydrotalea]MBY0349242.1 prephenate dehydrogenase [Hydrotalea flava]GHU01084.1 prephenate dehydrogenase [Betaproteobacteria bacterium]NIM35922.1 prephenate dehydrogenase [Hydrotalea flava]NIM38755.1 prephenate dehydrogenase [Hydrotalea flava]NIN03943.1 prephenate dehydrogenase [Hydrotalea flava]